MCLSAVRLVVSFVSARTVATIHCTTYIIQWYAIRSCSRSYVSRNQGTVCVPWVYRDIQSDLVLYTLNNVKVQVFRSEPYQYPCSCWPYSKHVVPNLSEGYFSLMVRRDIQHSVVCGLLSFVRKVHIVAPSWPRHTITGVCTVFLVKDIHGVLVT